MWTAGYVRDQPSDRSFPAAVSLQLDGSVEAEDLIVTGAEDQLGGQPVARSVGLDPVSTLGVMRNTGRGCASTPTCQPRAEYQIS